MASSLAVLFTAEFGNHSTEPVDMWQCRSLRQIHVKANFLIWLTGTSATSIAMRLFVLCFPSNLPLKFIRF